MMCLFTNQKNELAINAYLSKITDVYVENDELVINGIIRIPTEDLLEIKIRDKEVE